MFRQQPSGFHRVPFAQACDFDSGGFRTRALICNLSALGAYATSVLRELMKADATVS